jgi:lipid-A-disaccharide synthase
MGKKILMIGGEESGDIHGSSLIQALKELEPDISIKGMGGKKMLATGLQGIDSTELAVVGIVEVVKKLPEIKRAFRDLEALLKSEQFDGVVLIDYPDFNLRFAKVAHSLGVPVIYYISPQVWAWRAGRIKEIARIVDKMLVVFPFEEELYKSSGVDAEYVGHPLTDLAKCELTKAEARKELNIGEDLTVLALLPGSRTEEVKRLLPPMLGAIKELRAEYKGKLKIILPAACSISDELLSEVLGQNPSEVTVVRGKLHTVLRAADAATVASGTATLETALIGTPMLIIYKVSPLSYFVGRLLIGVDDIGLPNIVHKKAGGSGRIVPELVQSKVTPKNIAKELRCILKTPEEMIKKLSGLREILKKGTAAENTARAILKVISH